MHLANETVIATLVEKGDTSFLPGSEQTLTLTTHRVRSHSKRMGRTELESIMLEEVASCYTTFTSRIILLILAAIFFGGALFLLQIEWGEMDANYGPGILIGLSGFASLVSYFITRQRTLHISSAGLTIHFVVRGRINMRECENFIDQLEAAKNHRFQGTAAFRSS